MDSDTSHIELWKSTGLAILNILFTFYFYINLQDKTFADFINTACAYLHLLFVLTLT